MSAISLDTVAAQQVKHLTRVVTWVSDRFGWSEPTIVDSDYLRQLPPGTFGRVWISTMDAAGLSPFTTGPRRQQLHDGIHVLTGYNPDPLGEAEVQAFLLGAKFRVFHGVILSQMILAVGLFKPVARRVGQGYGQAFGLPELAKHVVRAYKRGRMAKLDPDRWQPETMWELPFEEVQAIFNVFPNGV
ncbi:MAG: hypothetical protein AAFS04_15480 [Cyanobacteria bacterium J06631_9]